MSKHKDDKPEVMERLEAMEVDTFDPVEYQEEGQGKPHKGLKKELKKDARRR